MLTGAPDWFTFEMKLKIKIKTYVAVKFSQMQPSLRQVEDCCGGLQRCFYLSEAFYLVYSNAVTN